MTNGKFIVFADDGGSSEESNFGYNFVRVAISLPASEGNVTDVPLSTPQGDLEGGAYDQTTDRFLLSGSLSSPESDMITSFKLYSNGTEVNGASDGSDEDVSLNIGVHISDELSRPARELVLAALKHHVVDQAEDSERAWREQWFERIASAPAKDGGLNVEGVAVGRT